MIILFGEEEKNSKAKYQKGAIPLYPEESLNIEDAGVMIVNYSKTRTIFAVSSGRKLKENMKVKIPLGPDDEGSSGPTGLLN